jgi:microcystin-dependent protein
MTQPFIGEIQLFGFNFNPRGWAFANGATLPISQNTALFSLLGTTYGGNGQTTLTSNQIPQHNHSINAYVQNDTTKRSSTPTANGGLSIPGSTGAKPFINTPINTTFAANMIQPTAGGGLPHENQQPYLGTNFCIALQGIYPSFP